MSLGLFTVNVKKLLRNRRAFSSSGILDTFPRRPGRGKVKSAISSLNASSFKKSLKYTTSQSFNTCSTLWLSIV